VSFLAWAFALGGLTVILPILFHLIRPTPRGSQKFSSLMFLRQSPPRISRRSRIDHWLLLIMRALVVLLLAAAFMRPFVRTGGEIFVSDLPGNRVALLVDTSASMRRGDLWQQAGRQLQQALDELQPGDDVALYAFDRQLQLLVDFSGDQVVDLENRKQLVRDRFRLLKPSWYHTDLGSALASAADRISELEERRRTETGLQIVLISDLQEGADLGSLQTFVWPQDVRVRIADLSRDAVSNATARVLPDDVTPAVDAGRRVRVVNAADSRKETFSVLWEDAEGRQEEESRTRFYVPPGTSQVLRVPRAASLTAERLVLQGDECEFDNRFFVRDRSRQQISIACITDDAPDDPAGQLYFLERVVPESRTRVVQVDRYPPDRSIVWQDGRTPRVLIVTGAVADEVAEQLEQFVREGGVLLAVVADENALGSLRPLFPAAGLGEPSSRRTAYRMLASIDFSHPLFRPLSGPRFNDFTNIRFWKHLPVAIDDSVDGSRVIARFDDDTVAVWQQRLGTGIAMGLSASWRPQDSQLALSTKFVPLMTSLLGMADSFELIDEQWTVGDTVALPDADGSWTMTTPAGQSIPLPEDAATNRNLLEAPGIYGFSNGEQQIRVAVNLHPAESRTAGFDPVRLESLDVRLGSQPSREELAGSLQKLQDVQLEQRQRVWKWLLLAAICLLALETLVAGNRHTRTLTSEAAA
jgi:hypothetical protein